MAVFFILWLTNTMSCSRFSSVNAAAWKSKAPEYQPPASGEIVLVACCWLTRILFHPAVGEIPEVNNCFRPKLLPAAIQSHGLQLVQGFFYLSCAVSYAVWFSPFTDVEQGLLTFMQGTAECVAHCSLWWLISWWGAVGVRWWCWTDSQVGYMDEWDRDLVDSWSVVKDKEDV